MQRVEQPMRLELTTAGTTSPLAIDMAEPAEERIQRLIRENPAVIFSRSSCCMCHVMKNLLHTVGVHPTVIELDEEDIPAIPAHDDDHTGVVEETPPVLFVGGNRVGGLESLVALHLTNRLVNLVVDAGAVDPLWA